MPHKILSVKKMGIAYRHNIKAGELLEAINGETLIDDIDYQALTMKMRLALTVINEQGEKRIVHIVKQKNAPLGITMDESMALKPRVCKNKCIFCFIDQMPKGMRDTLYVKDDDWRLSVMMGNFVTLTNVDDEEFNRILKRKVSPLYISVHTTNPDLRVFMMKNPNAKFIMDRLTSLKENCLSFHCQVVLCPNINDGEELKRTLSDLENLYPYAKSVALVPVGLTKCRQGLETLAPYTKEQAENVLQIASDFSEHMLKTHNTRFVFPSDEFYSIAGKPYLKDEQYEGYPQYENGVGLLRRFEEGIKDRMEEKQEPLELFKSHKMAIFTGTSLAPIMENWVNTYLKNKAHISVHPIQNTFFGNTVTVSGLLTGRDILSAAQNTDAEEILFSENTLRSEGDLFLDDMSLDFLKAQLPDKKITLVKNNGRDFYQSFLKEQL